MPDRQEQWAVFWCSLLTPLLYGEIDPSEAGAFLRQLTEQQVEFPDGTRRRPSRATLWRKYKQYRQGGFESLFRKRRDDRGKPREATPQMFDKAVELKKEQPLRSHQPINEFLRHEFQAEVPKSALLKRFLHQLEGPQWQPVYLHLTHLSSSGLLKLLVSKLGESPRLGKDRLFQQILDKARQAAGALLLVLDEAHLLDSEALTDIRLLVSSALDDAPPLNVILAGQEPLRQTLRRSLHTDLLNRVSVRFHLAPLGREQTTIYIDFQLKGAGGSEKLFDDAAKQLIHDYSGGIPRQINNLATACHVFHGVTKRFGTLRKFSPTLFRAIEFIAEAGDSPSLTALETLKRMNDEHKRKLPDDVTSEFVPNSLRRMVQQNGEKPERRAWECALLLQIRDDIRSGNISVKNSKRFGKFDGFFMPETKWQSVRSDFLQRAGVPEDPSQVPEYLRTRNNDAYDNFLESAPSNSYAKADEDGWHLSKDSGEELDDESDQKLEKLRAWLSKNMRRIRLPDLLIEVDNAIGFTKHFMTPTQRKHRTADDVRTILACIVYWQANEISRIVTDQSAEENDIDLSLLEHISPIEWDNVVLYGEYQLNKRLIRP